ncbi:MAG: efflux RND transporter periplasmic adaptor subunit [Phycisphaerales bacterium]|nr:efflux RND transporter periplasmic adaptor subunit [Phycisphaerales bacterium]
MGSMTETIRLGGVAALGVVLAAGSAWAQFGPARVVTAQAQMRHLPATVTLVGTVEPARRTTLGAEVSGLVLAMPARQGDFVKAGDVICRLNDDLAQRALAREEARLEARKARLAELENGTRAETIARLKAEVDAATGVANRWMFELKRIQALHGEHEANEREYQDAIAEHQSAISRRDAAQAEYDEAVAGPRPEVIAQARFEVAEQEAEVARLTTEIEKTYIRAPFSGFVSNRLVEVGTWLGAGDAVVELVDLETVLVRVNVPESAIAFATAGSASAVRIDALHDSFDGAIRHVIPQADEAARTFPVEIELPNPEHALKAGMFARATVPSGPSTEQLAVPKDALIDARGQIQVAMIMPGAQGKMAMPTFVTIGADADEWVAITSGNIPPGTEVATYGNEQLVYPQPVQVVETRAEVDAPPAPAQAAVTPSSDAG